MTHLISSKHVFISYKHILTIYDLTYHNASIQFASVDYSHYNLHLI